MTDDPCDAFIEAFAQRNPCAMPVVCRPLTPATGGI